MPSVTIVPFKWYHIKAMDLRADERMFMEKMGDYAERAKHYATRGPCYSVVVEGEGIACCWGLIEMWPGVYECWMITSTIIERYPVNTIRKARRCFDLVESEMQSHRMQIVVKASAAQSLRFASALSFKTEGVLKTYGPDGSDYIMMARCRDVWTIRRGEHGRAAGDATEAARNAAEAAGEA